MSDAVERERGDRGLCPVRYAELQDTPMSDGTSPCSQRGGARSRSRRSSCRSRRTPRSRCSRRVRSYLPLPLLPIRCLQGRERVARRPPVRRGCGGSTSRPRAVPFVPAGQGSAPLGVVEHLPLGEDPVAAEGCHLHRCRVVRALGEDVVVDATLRPRGIGSRRTGGGRWWRIDAGSGVSRFPGIATDSGACRAKDRSGGGSRGRGSSYPWPTQPSSKGLGRAT